MEEEDIEVAEEDQWKQSHHQEDGLILKINNTNLIY